MNAIMHYCYRDRGRGHESIFPAVGGRLNESNEFNRPYERYRVLGFAGRAESSGPTRIFRIPFIFVRPDSQRKITFQAYVKTNLVTRIAFADKTRKTVKKLTRFVHAFISVLVRCRVFGCKSNSFLSLGSRARQERWGRLKIELYFLLLFGPQF